ncbi:MAG: hypothetical protein CFE21_09130 [Bacteroidetes bacterium B1(2017)]|nr:MAG: hypothetical protein CFE21_09130 [Bacteroidetes bacterium B1(2017)]
MNRKEFIGKSIGAGMLPLVINGFSLQAFAESPMSEFLNKAGNEDHVLVLIQLNGGNDGLNTVIPLDQYSKLMNARANITIAEPKVLPLTGTSATGLHPSLGSVRNLYDNGYVSILQSVGYPNQDYSHFRSTDIWLTASDADQYVETGWMGRYLDTQFPGFPVGYPNATHTDPPAIQIGYMVSPALQGINMSLGMSITDPTNFYQFVSGTVDPAPSTPMGHELSFVRLVAQQTQQYSGSVKGAADKATNKSTLYPAAGTNTLADQLKIVARLIAGDLKTKVYIVNLGGFDTHSAQVSGTGTDVGVHATLLAKLSEGINAFQDDLKQLAIEDRVLGMTFSEFGRRIRSNDSLGTDHGAAAPLFVFGKKVNGGIYGANPLIPDQPTGGDNIPMQIDFRTVYASILKDWFGVSDADMNTVLLKSFSTLPFVNTNTSGAGELVAKQKFTLSNYPNPAQNFTTIRFSAIGERVSMVLLDANGRELVQLCNEVYPSGEHELHVNTEHLASGIYYYQMQNGAQVMSNKLVIRR